LQKLEERHTLFWFKSTIFNHKVYFSSLKMGALQNITKHNGQAHKEILKPVE